MSLIRETEYGKITVSNEVFKDTIELACNMPECDSDIWLAGKPAIEAEYGEDGRVSLEFSVVVRFGTPIKSLCRLVADEVAEKIRERSGKLPSMIKVNVTGVKSKSIVRRSMEVICE